MLSVWSTFVYMCVHILFSVLFSHMREDAVALERLQHCAADAHSHWAAAKGVEVFHAVGKGLGDLDACDDCGEGEAVAHRLPHRHNVWHHFLQFEAPVVG
jgi:hypothetical protein